MTTFHRIAAFVLLLGVALPVCAQSNALPNARHLVVKGSAAREVLPDRFVIHMTIEAVDPKPEAARARVQAHVAGLLQAMTRAHVLQDGMDATSLAIKPKTIYKEETEVFVGTAVSRTLRATFGRAEDLQAFLGEVVTSPEVQIDGVDTSSSHEQEIEAKLREEAIATTRRKADEMAKAYGAKISGLYGASDVAPSFSYGVEASNESGGRTLDRVVVTGSAIAPEELEVGTITLKVNIYAVFLLAD